MNNHHRQSFVRGLISPEFYSTAWAASVPHKDDPQRPAWPETLSYIRNNQLEDGGWGETNVYYVHGRIISTLACIHTLCTWKTEADEMRINKALSALHQYACDLKNSQIDEPIGFEILLPSLLSRLAPFQLDLPLDLWSEEQQKITALKMKHIGSLEIEYDNLRTWWFNLEILPDEKLHQIDDRILNEQGAVAGSTAATAAYLRANRLKGKDSPRAAAYLNNLLQINKSGVGVCYPIDSFELIWTLDSYMKAGCSPLNEHLTPLINELHEYWMQFPNGISWSTYVPLKDCDVTATAYSVLRWAGIKVAIDPLLNFWGNDYFLTYFDERNASISSNVHALSALRFDMEKDCNQKRLAEQVTEWLRNNFKVTAFFDDKWHISPFYTTAHAIHALAGWDNELACTCINYLLMNQDEESGGWGFWNKPTLEETSHVVLALLSARKSGLLTDDTPLQRAASFFQSQGLNRPTERLWIGKTLYCPIGVVQGTVAAAKFGLSNLGFSAFNPGIGIFQNEASI